ncbi:hypothetical protein [Ralstonia sp. UBA689]|uniref:hypothetical protein n=1 Tax=Ralstonia sp. UBA689 TaxID=1947373 RepID=UPI0025FF978F|nr:hypothetical protein [Ralstonia sp. UBA689]
MPSVDELANAVAIIAVGQAHHVANILHAAGLAPKPTTKNMVKGAIKLLSPSGNIGHRDGWMFQVMSWLAAQLRTPGGLMNAPHMKHADKGLDGLQVDIDGTGAVTAVVLFEDKATENPRDTVRDMVWPEFAEFEGGAEENVIAAEVAQLLARSSHPDPEQAVADIMWAQARRYRLSITDEQSTDKSQAKLFKGYATHVPGPLERRRAEVFEVIDLRKWMDDLAKLAMAKAAAFATKD